jgi:hypothetical protein
MRLWGGRLSSVKAAERHGNHDRQSLHDFPLAQLSSVKVAGRLGGEGGRSAGPLGRPCRPDMAGDLKGWVGVSSA